MALPSLKMTKYFVERGVVSKEAGVGILQKRAELFKEAGVKEILKSIGRGFSGKGRGDRSPFDVIKGGGPPTIDPSHGEMLGGTLGRAAKLLALGGSIAATGHGIDIYRDKRDANQMSQAQESAYRQMFQVEPDLKDDEAEVRSQFEVIRKYSPTFATDPYSMAKFIKGRRAMAGSPMGIDAATAEQLSRLENSIRMARNRDPRTLMSTVAPGLVQTAIGV